MLAGYLKEKMRILQTLTKVNVDVTTNEDDIGSIQDAPAQPRAEEESVWQAYEETLGDGGVRTVFKYQDVRERWLKPQGENED